MARPRNATPSEYAKADGTTSYRVRFDARGHTRTRTFTNRAAAEAFCHDLNTHGPDHALARIAEFEQVEADAATDTLDVVAGKFFDWKAARVRSDRTVADYRRDYANAIKPVLGARPIATITDDDVQAWIDGLVSTKGKRLSPKSIADRHALLHSIMDYAAAPTRRLITANPCKHTELPEKHRTPPKGLMPAQWQALYAALRQGDDDAADLALFLIGTGWRWSEATALPVSAVEDYGDRVLVSMTQVARRGASGSSEIVQDGKAAASLRRIGLDAEVAALVRRRIIGKGPDDLVFTTATGARWHYANYRDRHWSKAVATANIGRKPTIHWLRHTHVVWLALSGVELPELQARIGHASITTTLGVYGRMIQDAKPEALEAFAAMRSSGPSVAASPAPAAIAAADTSPGQP